MVSTSTSCIKCVDRKNICLCCQGILVKNGFSKAGKQRYKCKLCNKTIVLNYSYKAYLANINNKIILYIKEGLGIRSMARILKISTTTLLKRIIKLAKVTELPKINNQRSYEVDELCTFVQHKNKRIWIVYVLERETKHVVDFKVGARTILTLRSSLNSILSANPISVFTDKLIHYKSIISSNIHKTVRFGTNRIERKNLTLRTHIKRLNRKTICFSRSEVMLKAILQIYFANSV